MTTFLIIYFSLAMALWLWVGYRVGITKPVEKEQTEAPFREWHEFLKKNIATCCTREQCLAMYKMINLYDRQFRGKVTQTIFQASIAELWRRLEVRHRLATGEVEVGSMTYKDVQRYLGRGDLGDMETEKI